MKQRIVGLAARGAIWGILAAFSAIAIQSQASPEGPAEMAKPVVPVDIEKAWVARWANRDINALPVTVSPAEEITVLDQQPQLRDSRRHRRSLVGQLQLYGDLLIRANNRPPDILRNTGAKVIAGPAKPHPYSDSHGWRQADVGQLERKPYTGDNGVWLPSRRDHRQVWPLLTKADALLNSGRADSNYGSKIRHADSGESDYRRNNRRGIAQPFKRRVYLPPAWHALILIIVAIIITEGLVRAVSAERLIGRVAGLLIALGLIWLLFFR